MSPSLAANLASLPPSDNFDLKYFDVLGKQVVHFKGTPLCIPKPLTADAQNRILNLLAYKICTRKHFATYADVKLHNSGGHKIETKDVACQFSKTRYNITCTLEKSERECEKFIEVKCSSCHQEHTVSKANSVKLSNPLYPRLTPGVVCTYDVTLENPYKTVMMLEVIRVSLPPADHSVSPGRSQCVESYIQILQGWHYDAFNVLATVCDERRAPLIYNVTQPHVRIRFVSGNRFYPNLKGFSIIVSAHHVGFEGTGVNWEMFLPVLILIFFIIIFCIGAIYCFAIICTEERNRKFRRETSSWTSPPPSPSGVQTGGNEPVNPISRENPYIVDNTMRPRGVYQSAGTHTTIQHRSLPTPPIWSHHSDNRPPQHLNVRSQLQNLVINNSGLQTSNSGNNSDLYISVNRTNQSDISTKRTNQSGIYMNKTKESAIFKTKTNKVGIFTSRNNQTRQSIMSRVFKYKGCKPSPRNNEYEDMSGSSESDIYMYLSTPEVPRRPTWTLEQDVDQIDQWALDNDPIYQEPPPVYMTILKSSGEPTSSKAEPIDVEVVDKKYTAIAMEVGVEHISDLGETDTRGMLGDELIPSHNSTRDMINVELTPTYITKRNRTRDEPVPSNIATRDELLSPHIATEDMARDELVSPHIATRDMARDEFVPPRFSTRDMIRDGITQSQITTEESDLYDDFKTTKTNYRCVLSEMKKKIRNRSRSVSSRVKNSSVSSGGFIFWELDREELIQEDKDDVFE